jgi:hypothetical protein
MMDETFLRDCCKLTSALYACLAQPDIPHELARELVRMNASAFLAALDGDTASMAACFAKVHALIDAWERAKTPNS